MKFIVELDIEQGCDPNPEATAEDLQRFIEFCRSEFGFRSTSECADGVGYVGEVRVEPLPSGWGY